MTISLLFKLLIIQSKNLAPMTDLTTFKCTLYEIIVLAVIKIESSLL